MKKLIILTVTAISIQLNSQTIIGTVNQAKEAIGVHLQDSVWTIDLMASFETGHYQSTRVFKYSAGVSLPIFYRQDTSANFINLALCYNTSSEPINLKKVSFEFGITLYIERAAFLIMFDPINYEGKIGVGFRIGNRVKRNKSKISNKDLKYEFE